MLRWLKVFKATYCTDSATPSNGAFYILPSEIERAVAGASVESRFRAIGKLRARVKEQVRSVSRQSFRKIDCMIYFRMHLETVVATAYA